MKIYLNEQKTAITSIEPCCEYAEKLDVSDFTFEFHDNVLDLFIKGVYYNLCPVCLERIIVFRQVNFKGMRKG